MPSGQKGKLMAYFSINAIVTAKDTESFAKLKTVIKKYNCFSLGEDKPDDYYFGYSMDEYSDFPDALADEIAPYISSGDMDVANEDENDTDKFSRYRFKDGHAEYIKGEALVYYEGDEKDFIEQLPDAVIEAVKKKYGLSELKVDTPAGPIVAKVMPDKEYPGIIVENEEGDGQPAAILEYSPTAFGNTKSCMQLQVYDVRDPDDDPVAVYQMSSDIRKRNSATHD